MKGFSEVKAKVSALPTKIQTAASSGLLEVGREIFDASQGQVPVDTGALRASASIVSSGVGAKETVTVSYDTDYALYVHEALGNVHVSGNAKYLENPFNTYAPKLNNTIKTYLGGLL